MHSYYIINTSFERNIYLENMNFSSTIRMYINYGYYYFLPLSIFYTTAANSIHETQIGGGVYDNGRSFQLFPNARESLAIQFTHK